MDSGNRCSSEWYVMQDDVIEPRQIEKANVASGCSDQDLNAWIRALRDLPEAPVTESDVLAWIEGPLRGFFPFEKFLGAYGNLSGGRVNMRLSVSSGHAPEFLAGLENSFDLKSRGCFAWWASNRKPFIVDRTGALDAAGVWSFATKRSLEEMERF
jgi:DNA-binding CsgD family transcriptional regulator